jgi:hypothetical protein
VKIVRRSAICALISVTVSVLGASAATAEDCLPGCHGRDHKRAIPTGPSGPNECHKSLNSTDNPITGPANRYVKGENNVHEEWSVPEYCAYVKDNRGGGSGPRGRF